MEEKQSDVLGQRLSDKDVLCHLSVCLGFSKDIPIAQECLMAGFKCLSFSFHQVLFLDHSTMFV